MAQKKSNGARAEELTREFIEGLESIDCPLHEFAELIWEAAATLKERAEQARSEARLTSSSDND